MFDILFYLSFSICIAGVCSKIFSWTKKTVGYQQSPPAGSRFSGLVKGIISTVFSYKAFYLIKSLIFDILLQGRILKTSMLRWVMHFLVFTGFMSLLFMHALDKIFTEKLFAYYYSTINPFFFLRDLFGLMVITGIGIAVYRRYYLRPKRLKNASADFVAIISLLTIILSGVLLEGMKMTSVSEFTTMVEDYAYLDYNDDYTVALETYWVKNFALVSTRIKKPYEKESLELGLEIHEESCMDCHSPNQSAFMGYAVAKLISSGATFLDNINAITIIYYIHILSCFLGLALLPFSKMFHAVATPATLLANAVQRGGSFDSKNSLTKQIIELDACTHCSTCNLNCSAAMMYESLKNDYILPSEKMRILKKSINGKQLNTSEIRALFQGLYLCTNCDRCTVVCPSGINLKTLWLSVREKYIQQNIENSYMLSVFSFVRGLNPMQIEKIAHADPLAQAFKKTTSIKEQTKPLMIDAKTDGSDFSISLPGIDTFSHCFGCQNCSTICPVVASFQKPGEALILMPHEIMYCLGLGLIDMAKGSAMIWNCLSCYQCQEHCPQNVAVCDILFQLKNNIFHNIQET